MVTNYDPKNIVLKMGNVTIGAVKDLEYHDDSRGVKECECGICKAVRKATESERLTSVKRKGEAPW